MRPVARPCRRSDPTSSLGSAAVLLNRVRHSEVMRRSVEARPGTALHCISCIQHAGASIGRKQKSSKCFASEHFDTCTIEVIHYEVSP